MFMCLYIVFSCTHAHTHAIPSRESRFFRSVANELTLNINARNYLMIEQSSNSNFKSLKSLEPEDMSE